MARNYLQEIIECDTNNIEETLWEVCQTYEDCGKVFTQLAEFYSGAGNFDMAMEEFLTNWLTEYAHDVVNMH